jgi:UDP-N-acetylmuramoylalanine--D-glutamate ligase
LDYYRHVGVAGLGNAKIEVAENGGENAFSRECMSNLIATSRVSLIVGLGVTGLSVARYLTHQGQTFMAADQAPKAESIAYFRQHFPNAQLIIGDFDYAQWQGVSEIILSPGVPRRHPAIVKALAEGVPVVGDVELFARAVNAPVIAITGDHTGWRNGKKCRHSG